MSGAFHNADPSESRYEAGRAGGERPGRADETRATRAEEQPAPDGPNGTRAGASEPDDQASNEPEVDETFAAGEADPFASLAGLDELLNDDLRKIAAERDEYLQALQRLQADFDNFRKRAMRQQTETLERASEALLKQLLPVLDVLDLALAHHGETGPEGETKGASSGSPDGGGATQAAHSSLLQVGSLLRDTLAREGLERIDAVGVEFDPTMHDAVAHEPADGDGGPTSDFSDGDGGSDAGAAEGTESAEGSGVSAAPRRMQPAQPSVSEVLRAGYRLKGRVIRPAMVKVKG